MDSPKYNRTYHLPWSPGATNDDKIGTDLSRLIGCPIVITEKMDGSNTSLESEGCFSRSHAGPPSHPSFSPLKALHASLKHIITPHTQLFGEWCYAKHSIEYSELPGYFMLFNIRYLGTDLLEGGSGPTVWCEWEAVEMVAEYMGIPTTPVLFKGQVNSEAELKDLVQSLMIQPSACGGIREGVVVRIQDHFHETDFSTCVMKCVRANHVQTSEHWKDQEIVKNKLKLPTSGS
jgi:hypothetical protein